MLPAVVRVQRDRPAVLLAVHPVQRHVQLLAAVRPVRRQGLDGADVLHPGLRVQQDVRLLCAAAARANLKNRAPRDRRRPSAAFYAADSGCDPEPFCANPRYGQCGGQDPSGKPYTPACCPPGFHCESKSQYYSQCVPDDPPFVTA